MSTTGQHPSAPAGLRLDVDLGEPVPALAPFAPVSGLRMQVRYMVTDEQRSLLPGRSRAPAVIPPEAPLPQRGDVIYLSSTSAWGVELVVHEWLSPTDLNIEVWLTHVGSARERRPFGRTQ